MLEPSARPGYFVDLPSKDGIPSGFEYIGMFGCALLLWRTNARSAHCVSCRGKVGPGLGIYRREYRHSGYLCRECAGALIFLCGVDGYSENLLSNLQACQWGYGKFTAEQVVHAIKSRGVEPALALQGARAGAGI